MNREIKFRAWDSRQGLARMWFLDGFVKYGDGWKGGNPDYKFYELYFGAGFAKVDASTTTLMQFIGLKDKNGREMYESDICKIHFYHNKTSDIGVIEWMRDASFCIRGKSIYSPSFKSGGDFGEYPAVEVVGNIYQNPELVSKEAVCESLKEVKIWIVGKDLETGV